ncbi:MAG: hypothetical protein AVDCRST_MAG43-77 [uncultured Thermomicrobiales bacterium]|uniref:DUF2851 domain-containing protein n=1 Tax=uncultured Thermomicrobiales bacterium TaxID=1645740 RepID=A0A6J4U780_9BACT|nr:MAG: hypothetical protein AVDCRST_MAG43-77 [uncultured Thermomicrobiales bacterium]
MLEPIPFAGESGSRPLAARHPRELAMSAAWHGALARELWTVDGRRVSVIFHGHWSHGFGPDFSDAMIEIEGEGLVSGAIELHGRSSEWTAHGHHLDPRYNTVILHVVSRIDSAETRRTDGKIVPVVTLGIPDDVLISIDSRLPEIWTELGGEVCAADLARREPERVRTVIWHLGDHRLDSRVRRFEGELSTAPVADVALRGIFDAFGYSENRAPMGALADRLVRACIRVRWNAETADPERSLRRTAMVLGSAGFLPMSPSDAHISGLSPRQLAGIEHGWFVIMSTGGEIPVPASAWTRARTRPANHPVARLMCASALMDRTDGDPFSALLEHVRSRSNIPEEIRQLSNAPGRPALGQARAIGLTANVILPLALAFSRQIADSELEDAASDAWSRLPVAEWSRPAKRARYQVAGDSRLDRLGERGIQGLIHLDRHLCTPRRCYECPIATEVVRDRQKNGMS